MPVFGPPRSVHSELYQGCVLGAIFFALVVFGVYKKLVAIAPNESIACGYLDNNNFFGPPPYIVAIGDAMSEAYASVVFTVTIPHRHCRCR
jgi:hypothetical protein